MSLANANLSALFTAATVQTAFTAIASRLVGASFRIAEANNPKLRQTRVITDPPTVLKREVLSLGIIWCFTLLTNAFLAPWAKRKNISNFMVTFPSVIIGAVLSESISRMLAYRDALKKAGMPENAEQQTTYAPFGQRAIWPVKSPFPSWVLRPVSEKQKVSLTHEAVVTPSSMPLPAQAHPAQPVLPQTVLANRTVPRYGQLTAPSAFASFGSRLY